eukprot:COSAG02_NODE_7_length_64539_cov_120.393482_44_plen_398_part_00
MSVNAQSRRRLRRLSAHLPPTLQAAVVGTAEDPAVTLPLRRNVELEVDPITGQGAWNQADQRRKTFHSPSWAKQSVTMRSSDTLELLRNVDRRIGDHESVKRMTSSEMFSGMAVVRGAELLYEKYADDFGPECVHSIQSITKTNINLIFGRLLAEGIVDLEQTVGHYLPDIGSGYSSATLQQVIDMDVTNNFSEGYTDVYSPAPKPGETQGYSRMEISMGWRLPPVGEQNHSTKDYLPLIVSDSGVANNTGGNTQYKSTNTDVLGWIAEVVTGRTLISLLQETMEGVGLEGSFTCTCDMDLFPTVSGGGYMSARDLARYGLVFARMGKGIHGETTGNEAFLAKTLEPGRGTSRDVQLPRGRYSNMTMCCKCSYPPYHNGTYSNYCRACYGSLAAITF